MIEKHEDLIDAAVSLIDALHEEAIARWLEQLDHKCQGRPLPEIAQVVHEEVIRYKENTWKI